MELLNKIGQDDMQSPTVAQPLSNFITEKRFCTITWTCVRESCVQTQYKDISKETMNTQVRRRQ